MLNLDEVMADSQTRQRQMVVEMLHHTWGTYRQLGIAPKLSLTPGTIYSHAPELGEHTADILSGLGMDASTQQQLQVDGVI